MLPFFFRRMHIFWPDIPSCHGSTWSSPKKENGISQKHIILFGHIYLSYMSLMVSSDSVASQQLANQLLTFYIFHMFSQVSITAEMVLHACPYFLDKL